MRGNEGANGMIYLTFTVPCFPLFQRSKIFPLPHSPTEKWDSGHSLTLSAAVAAEDA